MLPSKYCCLSVTTTYAYPLLLFIRYYCLPVITVYPLPLSLLKLGRGVTVFTDKRCGAVGYFSVLSTVAFGSVGSLLLSILILLSCLYCYYRRTAYPMPSLSVTNVYCLLPTAYCLLPIRYYYSYLG